ncbi:MAG: hypothetical protein Q4G24_06910 [Paracoccus sp. (in: a-proteobacteria)]|uniref:hypothetical protein n=1 Tax=Paracoccus sp. TaxID=267 RepID=UPI0026DF38C2|nr:hypothetical protein [Paracoccus sp. (in: a-proteobacteria)]MDO5621183.1 hypothetical protein [Paracoccus sp. (in: a-proteobacteria)]
MTTAQRPELEACDLPARTANAAVDRILVYFSLILAALFFFPTLHAWLLTVTPTCKILNNGPMPCSFSELWVTFLWDPVFKLAIAVGILFGWLLLGKMVHYFSGVDRSGKVWSKVLPPPNDDPYVMAVVGSCVLSFVVALAPVLILKVLPPDIVAKLALWLGNNLAKVVIATFFICLGLVGLSSKTIFWVFGAASLIIGVMAGIFL